MRSPIASMLLASLVAVALMGCAPATRADVHADPALDSMFLGLSGAASAEDSAPIEAQIWAHWADSGSPTVNILLERAAAAESAGDPDRAIRFLNEASALAPDFAEPWNRRASLAYETEDYTGAIAAIQEALKREPRHFGALAGLGLIYEELGQDRAALEAFRAALAVHPHYDAALRGVARLEPRVDGRDA
jgi:tetratricopeptide (TPR) repeat protein